MRKFRCFVSVIGLIMSLPIFVSCVGGAKDLGIAGDLKPITKKSTPLRLVLNKQEGHKDLTQFYSYAMIHNFEGSQLVKEREEIVEFDVESFVTKSSVPHKLSKDVFAMVMKTVRKDGTVDLHDFAFPEKGEAIEYHLDSQGRVFKAGDYHPSSVFFVPPVALPQGEVQVGDTWELKHSWITSKNNLPLQMDIAVIFKNLYQCGSHKCADLELSGNVVLLTQVDQQLRFNSELSGRMLFVLEEGTVVWSEMHTKEEFVLPESHVLVTSCLSSAMVGVSYIKVKPKCQPRPPGA